MVERLIDVEDVRGSSPLPPTMVIKYVEKDWRYKLLEGIHQQHHLVRTLPVNFTRDLNISMGNFVYDPKERENRYLPTERYQFRVANDDPETAIYARDPSQFIGPAPKASYTLVKDQISDFWGRGFMRDDFGTEVDIWWEPSLPTHARK